MSHTCENVLRDISEVVLWREESLHGLQQSTPLEQRHLGRLLTSDELNFLHSQCSNVNVARTV